MTIGTRSYDVGSVQPLELDEDVFSECHEDGPGPLSNVWNPEVCVWMWALDLSAVQKEGREGRVADDWKACDKNAVGLRLLRISGV